MLNFVDPGISQTHRVTVIIWEMLLLLLLSHFTRVRLFATPYTAAHQDCQPRTAKNTEVGCHFLLQCMKMKSESEVAQSCLTHSDPMDCSPSVWTDYYSNLNRKGTLTYATIWMELENMKWNKPVTEGSVLYHSSYRRWLLFSRSVMSDS